MAGRRTQSARRRTRRGKPVWEDLPDEALLDLRLCDLGLRVEGTPLESRVERLYAELARAGLRFRPHVWLSTAWFSPEGVPGIAIPFYLAHPRLARLERRMLLQVEGGNRAWCMKLLRHEAGHALDTAWRLRRRRRWRQAFGHAGLPYRATYVPDPWSRRFVFHLYHFYAQSHPVEDFAETFAVWLRPGRRWRARYAGSPALRKLEAVDEMVREIAERPPLVRSRERTDEIGSVRTTLREYYRRKRQLYGQEDASIYDRDLCHLFSRRPEDQRRKPAARFLRERRPELRELVTQWTDQPRFAVDDVLGALMRRSRALGLHLARSERESFAGAAVLVAAHAGERLRHAEYRR